MGRVLTQTEWNAFAAVESKLYDDSGFFAFSDVAEREDSDTLAVMWDTAQASVELWCQPGWITQVVADRVARAQYFVVIGEMPLPTVDVDELQV